MSMRKIRVGITVNISSPTESLFTNGIKQNAITFWETFSACENVSEVYFINLGTQKDLSKSPWGAYGDKIIGFNEALDKVDLVVTVTVAFTDQMLELLGRRGVKVVKHVLGTEYHTLAESVVFGREVHSSYSTRSNHSAVWLSPHIYPSNKDLVEVLCNAKAYEAPFVWSPKFLQAHVDEYVKANGKEGFYRNKGKEKKVSVFEPNISVVKTCITPIIAGEKFYRKSPDMLKKLSIFGAAEIKKSKVLIEFVASLDVNKAKKIFFEHRYPIAWSLLEHTDIVLSHQRDLALNYLYFDAAWLGFPVVHNAHFVKELGFYYDEFDAERAADLLVDVAKNFDSQSEEYLKKSREYISKFLPTEKANVEGYAELIEIAMK